MTELIWDGKYDKDGQRVAPLRVALPFQTVETVNESAQQRQMALDLFSAGRDPQWRNRLIWGDKKYVLPALLDEFAGQVNLIYIDPPFNVGADFSFTATIPDNPETEDDETTTFVKEPSVIEVKAYRDTWGRGLDSYLQWFYETAALLRELLAEDGSIYVHLDWHIGTYAKIVLDEVFGLGNFRNAICWQKIRAVKHQSRNFGNVSDLIFLYSTSDRMFFQAQFRDHEPAYIRKFDKVDEQGRRYQLVSLVQKGDGPPRKFEGKVLYPPPGMHWIWSQERIDEALAQGLIEFTSTGTPRKRQYYDDTASEQVDDIWTDIAPVNSQAVERTGYPTQKPETLLDRILRASSNEGDLVLDCFCGSGTTPAVAEKLGRRWIACDLGRFAIHTTRKRLLGIESVRPFVVQNLGKYERQVWQVSEFGSQKLEGGGQAAKSNIQPPTSNLQSIQRAYIHFILDLYHARPITGTTWLHGVRRGRMVHVGAVDAPVSTGDVTQMVIEFKRAVGSGADAPATNGIDVLGWDFAFELNEVAKQQAAQAKVDLRFLRIPRDVMDRRAVEQGDVRFFELAALSVDVTRRKRSVTLTLTDFVIPPDDVPQDVQRAITHWSQWIDYWAVDWDNKGDTFHNEWQTYRTRKSRELQRSVTHTYDAPGEYTVVVKVIDILGNDTTRTLKIRVG